MSGPISRRRETLEAAAPDAGVKRAEGKATVLANDLAGDHYGRAQENGRSSLEATRGIVTDAKALADAVRSGRMSVAEAHGALSKLRATSNAAGQHRELFNVAAAAVTKIEADPVAYADELYERFPSVAPDFAEEP